MAATKIGWTNKTLNPVSGCSKVSTGCRFCYAARMAKRLAGRHGYPKDDPFRVTLHPDKLAFPKRWKKPCMIFLNSMSDWMHDDVPTAFIHEMFDMIDACPQHMFQTLTKRPERFAEIPQLHNGKARPNLWLGVTVENQKQDWRIPILLDTPAAVRFISVEPMLSEIGIVPARLEQLSWVIIGPETGPGARECNPAWIGCLIAQCSHTKTPVFVKAFPMPNGKVSHKIEEWPSWAQVQQYPDVVKESPTLEDLAKSQGVKPLTDVGTIVGTWPGEVDDGSEQAVDDLRKASDE